MYELPKLKPGDLAGQLRDIELRGEFRAATGERRFRLLRDIAGHRRPEMYQSLLRDPELLAADRNARLAASFNGMWHEQVAARSPKEVAELEAAQNLHTWALRGGTKERADSHPNRQI